MKSCKNCVLTESVNCQGYTRFGRFQPKIYSRRNSAIKYFSKCFILTKKVKTKNTHSADLSGIIGNFQSMPTL